MELAKYKRIITTDGTVEAPCVILATGCPRLLHVPGEDRLRGGVFPLRRLRWCFCNDRVAIVGGGDSAVEAVT